MTTSRMRKRTPFGPTDPNYCVINFAKFLWKSVQGFRS